MDATITLYLQLFTLCYTEVSMHIISTHNAMGMSAKILDKPHDETH